jgi:hypothetical protein
VTRQPDAPGHDPRHRMSDVQPAPSPPEHPPGFVVRTALGQGAWDKGFRLEREPIGGWLAYDSTTARGRVRLAGSKDSGPWWLATDHLGVAAEFGRGLDAPGPGLAVYTFADTRGLYDALDRAYRLGASLPDAPLTEFTRETAGPPRSTEAERLVVQRVGQEGFRRALLQYWDGRCAVTGISDSALLRASHIVPWSACTSDAQRLDVNNGLLLSALWDAAFDAGLVTFDDGGAAIFDPSCSTEAVQMLSSSAKLRRTPTPQQREFLQHHRRMCGVGVSDQLGPSPASASHALPNAAPGPRRV